MKLIIYFLSAAGIFLLNACSFDPRADAVEDAREYALKHARNLSAVQLDYIRYNEPEIMSEMLIENIIPALQHSGHLVTRYDINTYKAPSRDFMMHCIVWKVPGLEEEVMVYGTSLRNFREWYSEKLVFHKNIAYNQAGEELRVKAVGYLLTAFPNLTDEERLYLRFGIPEVYRSHFLLDKPEKNQSEDWTALLNESAEEEKIQLSAVWTLPGSQRKKIVCGTLTEGALGSWEPEKVYDLSPEQAKNYLEYQVVTAADLKRESEQETSIQDVDELLKKASEPEGASAK